MSIRRVRRPPKSLQRRNGWWYIRFYDRTQSPTKRDVATGVPTEWCEKWRENVPQGVIEQLAELGQAWREGTYDPWRDDAPEQLLVKEATHRFLRQREKAGNRPETLKAYRTMLLNFERSLSPGLTVDRISADHIHKYLTRLGLADSTREVYYNRFRAFFKWAVEKRHVWGDPMRTIRKPDGGEERREILLPADVDRLLTSARDDQWSVVADVIEFGFATGMRRGEILSRQWAQYKPDLKLLEVSDTRHFKTKTKQSRRRVPLSDRALSILARRIDAREHADASHDLIFPAPRGGMITGDWISKRFKYHAQRAMVNELATFHWTRHTNITYLLASGSPESGVMRWVGITKHDTIARYTHIVDLLTREAYDQMAAQWLPGYRPQQNLLVRQMVAWLFNVDVSELGNGDYLVTGGERIDKAVGPYHSGIRVTG